MMMRMMMTIRICEKHLFYISLSFNEQLIIPLKKHDTRQQQEHRNTHRNECVGQGEKISKNHGKNDDISKIITSEP